MASVSKGEWTIDTDNAGECLGCYFQCSMKNANLKIYAMRLHLDSTIKMTQSINREQRIGAWA